MSPIKLNGSTSGFVALDAPAAAGSNTLVLPTGNGSNGQVLTTNGSGTLSWSSITTGKILQVVQSTTTSGLQESTASTSYVDTSISVSITPSSSSSKILISVTSQAQNNGFFGLSRNGTDIAENIAVSYSATWIPVSFLYLDSPSTTSAITYKLRYKAISGTFFHGWGNYSSNSKQNIIAMEVAA